MSSKENGFADLCQAELGVLSAAAHELKTPLTIISHLTSVLNDKNLKIDDVEKRIYLERIQMSADRTLRLVQGLTTSFRLSQPGQLAFELELEPLNALQICEEVAAELWPFAATNNQKVEIAAFRKTHLVVGNRQMLHSVFFNLIDNALKHNPPETKVLISAKTLRQMVRINVRDNGPGVSNKDFTQLKNRLGKHVQPILGHSGSSGLGLYIAGQLLAAMGGNLGVGRVNNGADFRLDLLRSNQLSLF